MAKILVLHDPIHSPLFAPRMRLLCNYLMKKGWDVTLCALYGEKLRFDHDYRIELIRFHKYHRGTTKYEIDWAWKFLLTILFNYKERFFSRKVEKLFANEQFDMVCCSTSTDFTLKTAYNFAKRRNIPLHVDLRDIIEQRGKDECFLHRSPKFFRRIVRRQIISRRNAIIRKVQSITTVSPWHVDFLSKINKHVELIYNGFDRELFFPQDVVNEHFKLVYAGELFPIGYQDPTLLFEAIHHLKKAGKIDNRWFGADFYVSEKAQKTLLSMAAKYHVAEFCHFDRYVAPKKIPEILHNSSIGLIFANKCREDGPQGIMTTKFFEYLGVEKPVICVRSDESLLAETIDELNAGISVTDSHQIEEYILEKVDEWRKNGFTRQPVNQEKRQLFTRQRQAEQFIEIFERLMQK